MKNPRSRAVLKIAVLHTLTVFVVETNEYDETVGDGLKPEILSLAYVGHQKLLMALLDFAEVCLCQVMDRHIYSKIFAPALLATLSHNLPAVQGVAISLTLALRFLLYFLSFSIMFFFYYVFSLILSFHKSAP